MDTRRPFGTEHCSSDVVAKNSQVRSAKKELPVWPDIESLMRSEAFTMSCTAMFPVGLDRRHPNRVRIGTKSATWVTSQAVSRQCSWTSTLHSVWGPGAAHMHKVVLILSILQRKEDQQSYLRFWGRKTTNLGRYIWDSD